MALPAFLTEKLATCPRAGDGVHAWLFSVGRQLWAHMDGSAIEAVLTAATASAGRRVTTREIRDAARNSQAVAWKRGEEVKGAVSTQRRTSRAPDSPAPDRWPAADPVARRCRVADSAADGVAGLADLWERSPLQPEGVAADDWLDVLFPGAEWLCLAADHPATARSRTRDKWSFGPAEDCGLVVPSPMTGPSGRGLDGKQSHRCLGNTGPRRWLVIEFDSGGMDEQAALHWHLRTSARAAGWPALALCVFSGGKSLHGWYGPCGEDDVARDLMGYAVSLGADYATWNRCQLVRLPGGRRARKASKALNLPDGWEADPGSVTQEVFFYEP